MAQETYIYMNVADTLQTSPNTYHSSTFCLSTSYGYQLDLDLKYVDDIEQRDTIRRLGFNRRPRANPASEAQSRVDPSHWASSESLSSVSSDEARNPSVTTSSSISSSVNRRRPPLPPSHSLPKSTSGCLESSQAPPASHRPSDGKPPPVACQPTASEPDPLVERTLVETRRRLEQEKVSSQAVPQELGPRRRLASFGGVSSSGTLSPYTSWNALNQTQAVSKQSVGYQPNQGASTMGSSMRISPLSSGRATPVTSVSPLHLQLVRDQMVVALERLKELEDQVKTIPILQNKISTLQEEKRQLIALVKQQEGGSLGSTLDSNLKGLYRKRAHSTGSALQCQQHDFKTHKTKEGKRESSEEVEDWEQGALSGLQEFKQLSAEMHLLEKKIHDARLAAQPTAKPRALNRKSLTVNENKNRNEDCKCAVSSCWDVAVEKRSTAVCVTEAMLGMMPDSELEIEMHQQTIQVLSDRILTLEAELKEALLKAEMCTLKDELREAGFHNRAEKSSSAQPKMQTSASQTTTQTRTVGVGNNIQLVHAAVGGEVHQTLHTVGVTCRPEMRDMISGPDVPIDIWEVRKRVLCRDQCVGKDYVPTCSKAVGTSVIVRDTGMVTMELMHTLGKRKVPSRTIGCGDCTVDMNVNVVKPLVSKGTVTDPVRGIDLGVAVNPQTMSQTTSTTIRTVSRCTGTSQAYVSESSTNTTNMLTRERHTNTASVVTRTLAIGDGKVNDQSPALKKRSIAVGTTGYLKEGPVVSGIPKVMTRDTGVGLANVNENYLVGLRTRNIACGPSRLPDPIKTRSIGVEVGDGRIRDINGHMQILAHPLQSHVCAESEPGLDHYIDRMQKLLKEQQSLLTDGHCEAREEQEVMLQMQDHRGLGHGSSSKMNNISEHKMRHAERTSKDYSSDDGSPRSIIKRQDMSLRAESRKTVKCLSARFEQVSTSEDSFSEGAVSGDEENWKRKRGEQLVDSPRTRRKTYEMSEKVLSYCHSLKAHLNGSKALSNRELQEWFRVSSQKKACPDTVEDFLYVCRSVSPAVLTHVANISDQNGNTALHYSVSHSNFRVVQKLLDADVCNIDQQNKAGYTPIMLAALAAVETQEDMRVVEGLFKKGDVNTKAIQAGQTALMLAVSHGHMDMVKVLLASGSKVNIQDDEGSTALMCASEHGHADIVRLLLSQPGCDATLSDNDDSTALSIALEAGHKDIAMLLYAHVNYAKGQSMRTPQSRTPPAAAAKALFE